MEVTSFFQDNLGQPVLSVGPLL